MNELLEFQGNFKIWMQQIKTLLTSWMKISWNAHDKRTFWHSDWQLNCQICLFYVYCTSKPDYYILDAPVSNRLITEQEVSECLDFFYCSWAQDNIHKFLNKMFKRFLDSFGSLCIISLLTSVIRLNQW